MKYRLRMADSAWTEIFHAKQWYESQQFGCGKRFEDAVVRTVNLVLERPMMYPEYEFDARKAVVKDFPYLVLYRIVGDEVWIVAVYDGRQRGPQWRP